MLSIDKNGLLEMLKKNSYLGESHAEQIPSIEKEKELRKLSEESEAERLKQREKAEVLEMRKSWSFWLLICIVSIVAFDMIIIMFLGFHFISFEKQYLVPVVIGESLLKIVGLAIIVVGFLFDKNRLTK